MFTSAAAVHQAWKDREARQSLRYYVQADGRFARVLDRRSPFPCIESYCVDGPYGSHYYITALQHAARLNKLDERQS